MRFTQHIEPYSPKGDSLDRLRKEKFDLATQSVADLEKIPEEYREIAVRQFMLGVKWRDADVELATAAPLAKPKKDKRRRENRVYV